MGVSVRQVRVGVGTDPSPHRLTAAVQTRFAAAIKPGETLVFVVDLVSIN